MQPSNAESWSGALVDDLKKLQGTWQQIACEVDGVANPPEEYGVQPIVTISGNAFEVRHSDGTVVIKGTFSLDPLRDPKAMDWTDTYGADAGKTFPAIYCFAADTFTFCAADEDRERPRSFHTEAGQVLRVHKRATAR
jgi:uncharacterized protein (TIGR03067 family)